MSSSETDSYVVCQNHQELCEEPDIASDKKKKKPCAGCGKTGQRIVNIKTSVAVSKCMDKKVVIGEYLCTKCASIELKDMDSFYDYMREEHRLAQQDEVGETGAADESLMDTDMNPPVGNPGVSYMEQSDDEEEDEDPGYTLSQGSSQGTDWMNDYYKRQAETVLSEIQATFRDLNLPKTTFGSGNYKSRTTKCKIQGKLQNLLFAISKLLFIGADQKVALQYMSKAFDGYREMIEQGASKPTEMMPEMYRELIDAYMECGTDKVRRLNILSIISRHFTERQALELLPGLKAHSYRKAS